MRHIPGSQNSVADYLLQMETKFRHETAFEHMSSFHSDISALLHMNEYKESENVRLNSGEYG